MTPLICTMLVISVYVLVRISTSLLGLVDSVAEVFYVLKQTTLHPLVLLSADFTSALMEISSRDLFVFNRLAGWLYFGALQTSNATYPGVVAGAEACKNTPPDETCLAIQDTPITTCDCAWNNPYGLPCKNYEYSRPLQRVFFEGLTEDVFYPEGKRNLSSYPEVGRFPNETEWWSDVDSLPGANRTDRSSSIGNGRFDTTYDRVRILGALSMIMVPLHNYAIDPRAAPIRFLGTYIGFETGGVVGGYAGCNYGHAEFAYFQSDEANKAYVVNASLCPEGKFGFDPRCRDW
eukprot:CAMPEP_0116868720 /NCGR_PEP_ID=MMETSP0418-20121206/27357_1 /TAXON_ID=1158023 /ORGANISM="Astrosyne radiata, Strain 13vi08-1A" /LENGTH=290 /DNA_ID=CAMNT_0004504729 /DNA_START=53 /DNA_END=922 /DNA_ORIENTATION=+